MYSDFQPSFLSTSQPANPTESAVNSDLGFDDDSVAPVIREEDPSALTPMDYLFTSSLPIDEIDQSIQSADWNLPLQTIEHLRAVKRFDYFNQERQKPPFPAEYAPTVVDILYDDMLAIRSESGQKTYQAKRLPAQVTLVEFYFDDQLGLALIHGSAIVDRTSAMADLDAYLGRLPGGQV